LDDAPRPFYGYYALPIFALLSAISIVVGTFVAVMWHLALGLLIVGFGCCVTATYIISILLAGQTRPSTLPSSVADMLELRGDERVLDVGCGLGKMSVAVAKLLRGGKVIGVDIWDKVEIPGNSPERAFANARLERVQDRVDFRNGNVLELPFSDSSFDLVTASSVMNNLHADAEKLRAFNEVLRVLRPGGRFLLWEPLRDLRGVLTFGPLGILILSPRQKWTDLLSKTGFTDLRYAYARGMGAFLVHKPS